MVNQGNSISDVLYIRRCHVCGCVNESDKNLMSHCHHCGKYLVPFLFCSDVGSEMVQRESLPERPEDIKTSSFLRKDYPPICGISLYW